MWYGKPTIGVGTTTSQSRVVPLVRSRWNQVLAPPVTSGPSRKQSFGIVTVTEVVLGPIGPPSTILGTTAGKGPSPKIIVGITHRTPLLRGAVVDTTAPYHRYQFTRCPPSFPHGVGRGWLFTIFFLLQPAWTLALATAVFWGLNFDLTGSVQFNWDLGQPQGEGHQLRHLPEGYRNAQTVQGLPQSLEGVRVRDNCLIILRSGFTNENGPCLFYAWWPITPAALQLALPDPSDPSVDLEDEGHTPTLWPITPILPWVSPRHDPIPPTLRG